MLLRLYIAVALPWVLWFGYGAYRAHAIFAFNRDYMAALDATPGSDRSGYIRAALVRDEYQRQRNSDLKWLALVPAGLPIVMWTALWVAFGLPGKRK